MTNIRVIKKHPSPTKRHAYLWGIAAEWLAAALLILKGYKIIRRRYRNKLGEIDLIAQKHDTLVFVEVKARKIERAALESISARQKIRIERSARIFASRPPYHRHAMRFDVIACSPWSIPTHIINAWQPLG